MNIALIGYGEVGRILAEDLRARGEAVVAYDLKLDTEAGNALREHAAAGFLAHGESAHHKVLQHAMEIRDGQILGPRQMAVSRDISQEIDTAKCGIDLLEHFRNRIRVGHICFTDQSSPTESGNLCRGGLRAR